MVRSSILSGIFISLGCIINICVGGIPGAVLFAFGLISICWYELKLYTGTAGFIKHKYLSEWKTLGFILMGNVIGCGLMATFTHLAKPDLYEKATIIGQTRLEQGPIACFLLAIGCGLIMTTIVEIFKIQKTTIPILLGIPVFILSGFTHSIADTFYFLTGQPNPWLLVIWVCEVAGNFIGCNIYPWLGLRKS